MEKLRPLINNILKERIDGIVLVIKEVIHSGWVDGMKMKSTDTTCYIRIKKSDLQFTITDTTSEEVKNECYKKLYQFYEQHKKSLHPFH